MKQQANPVLKKIAETVIDPVIRFLNFPFALLVGKSVNMEKTVLRPIMKSFTKHCSDYVYQYTALPKNVALIPAEWPDDGRFSEYAIILQGPIRTEDHFTVDTVNFYIRCYSGASVIVSTWTGSDPKAKEEIQNMGAYWVETKMPDDPGAGNVNLQLTSSLEGVKKAKSLGCRFAIKTRTDQRFCANDALQYFRNLQEMFPSADQSVATNRLVYTGGEGSFRYLPFCLRDFVVFGETEELEKLYHIQRDNRPAGFHNENIMTELKVIKMIADDLENTGLVDLYEQFPGFEKWFYKYIISEQYIVFNYFKENIGNVELGDNLMDAYYWYLKNYAVVADTERLALYWPKYAVRDTYYVNEWSSYGKMTFKKWLEIYLHYQPKKDWSFSDNT